jgi:hypothetical protein
MRYYSVFSMMSNEISPPEIKLRIYLLNSKIRKQSLWKPPQISWNAFASAPLGATGAGF